MKLLFEPHNGKFKQVCKRIRLYYNVFGSSKNVLAYHMQVVILTVSFCKTGPLAAWQSVVTVSYNANDFSDAIDHVFAQKLPNSKFIWLQVACLTESFCGTGPSYYLSCRNSASGNFWANTWSMALEKSLALYNTVMTVCHAANCSGIVVEHFPCCTRFEGSRPATATATG
jgi:hypothetical protein